MVKFRMVGRDVNSSPTQYRTWVASTPDFDGYYYTGLKSGPEPLIDITIYDLDGYDGYPLAFNLPDPIKWKTSKRVLPEIFGNSHFCILDGYAYLFGAELSDKILRADLNNPADWIDTETVLPTPLCGASLSIIDGYIYLFGGSTDALESVDTIYRAPTADPLTWTDMGHLLPKELRQSQTAIIDGYVYLFGGRELNVATNVIYRAPLTNPLLWSDTGAFIPTKLYGSQIAIMNNKVLLLGGLTFSDAPTANVYQASLTTPTVWSTVGTLPWPSCFGQFFTVGSKGYLITPSAFTGTQSYVTRIFSCNKSLPYVWNDTNQVMPGDITQSQVAVIYDRLFLFGGNGLSVIFASDQKLKFLLGPGSVSDQYGNITRTQYQALSNPNDQTILIGFPWWKTDYEP